MHLRSGLMSALRLQTHRRIKSVKIRPFQGTQRPASTSYGPSSIWTTRAGRAIRSSPCAYRGLHPHGHGSTASGPAPSADLKETATRRQYARIRLVDTGVRAPAAHTAAPPVPFVLLLEPLYFGVLPASTAPLLALLLPVTGTAAILAQVVHRYLEQVAQRARVEIVDQTDEKAQKAA
ncbi:hypothetical protein EWM64_g6160 [Hericium alpestre]|uniref:Uncharacterized protein n=1 Tax=Hericium alpestre TaxID=135208 RepID=A0A4Y9ZVE8_9AGAM|nr:hypothetical protein EWM64_g6160 [Hericium alpestre]